MRILLQVLNDLLFVRADDVVLQEWGGRQGEGGSDEEQVASSATSLRKKTKLMRYIKQVAEYLSTYDWRASSGPKMTEGERTLKASFRGSGGYKELRKHVLRHVADGKGNASKAAEKVLQLLGY